MRQNGPIRVTAEKVPRRGARRPRRASFFSRPISPHPSRRRECARACFAIRPALQRRKKQQGWTDGSSLGTDRTGEVRAALLEPRATSRGQPLHRMAPRRCRRPPPRCAASAQPRSCPSPPLRRHQGSAAWTSSKIRPLVWLSQPSRPSGGPPRRAGWPRVRAVRPLPRHGMRSHIEACARPLAPPRRRKNGMLTCLGVGARIRKIGFISVKASAREGRLALGIEVLTSLPSVNARGAQLQPNAHAPRPHLDLPVAGLCTVTIHRCRCRSGGRIKARLRGGSARAAATRRLCFCAPGAPALTSLFCWLAHAATPAAGCSSCGRGTSPPPLSRTRPLRRALPPAQRACFRGSPDADAPSAGCDGAAVHRHFRRGHAPPDEVSTSFFAFRVELGVLAAAPAALARASRIAARCPCVAHRGPRRRRHPPAALPCMAGCCPLQPHATQRCRPPAQPNSSHPGEMRQCWMSFALSLAPRSCSAARSSLSCATQARRLLPLQNQHSLLPAAGWGAAPACSCVRGGLALRRAHRAGHRCCNRRRSPCHPQMVQWTSACARLGMPLRLLRYAAAGSPAATRACWHVGGLIWQAPPPPPPAAAARPDHQLPPAGRYAVGPVSGPRCPQPRGSQGLAGGGGKAGRLGCRARDP